MHFCRAVLVMYKVKLFLRVMKVISYLSLGEAEIFVWGQAQKVFTKRKKKPSTKRKKLLISKRPLAHGETYCFIFQGGVGEHLLLPPFPVSAHVSQLSLLSHTISNFVTLTTRHSFGSGGTNDRYVV